MALPIDPESGLFPDEAEPAFIRSAEVKALADGVIVTPESLARALRDADWPMTAHEHGCW